MIDDARFQTLCGRLDAPRRKSHAFAARQLGEIRLDAPGSPPSDGRIIADERPEP